MRSQDRSFYERQSHTFGVRRRLFFAAGADLVTAGPGPDLASLEDQSWRNKVSQQMQRIEPNLLVVLFQCTGVSPLRLASSNWLTQLVPEQKWRDGSFHSCWTEYRV